MSEHAHESTPHGHDDHEHHAVPMKTYWTVFGVLCVLTMASFLTYTEIWRDQFSTHAGWSLMMAVSCSKALLVILFFMHLKYEANWKYVLTIPAAFMSVFLMLMLVPDVGRRMYRYSTERWEHTSDYTGAAFYISELLPLPEGIEGGDHAAAHDHNIEHRHADEHGEAEAPEHISLPPDAAAADQVAP